MEQEFKDRITKLEQERDQLRAQLIAYEGAIQEAKYWLSQQAKEEVKE